MCGIAGFYNFSGDHRGSYSKALSRMLHAMYHRGPDDEGTYEEETFCFGMRRLSIIDLRTGKQPIFNEDKRLVTVFNGEIYNYKELKSVLLNQGHSFYSNSDTEVIVHLYEEYGVDFLKQLNGMFTIALWDTYTKTLILARDRLGVKPLYYYVDKDRLIFASELKAILASGLVNPELETSSIYDYLSLWYVPQDKAIFKGIQKLEPGHYLVANQESVKVTRWWDLADYYYHSSISKNEAIEEIKHLVTDSVRLRMRSDVPVGAFLSGGVDSSVVVALASKFTTRMNTFSVGFRPTEFDETPFAKLVAQQYNTTHHELIIEPKDVLKNLDTIVAYLDEPIGDSSIIPSYLISQFTAQKVKVVLTGLGGDELFGGYPWYYPCRGKGRLARLLCLPKPFLQSVVKPILETVNADWGDQINYLLSQPTKASVYLRQRQVLRPDLVSSMVADKIPYAQGYPIVDAFQRFKLNDEYNNRMFTDALTYLPDQILALSDRLSMAASLEAREPLLDYRLVEFMFSLPGAWKLDGDRGKAKLLLLECFGDLLPSEVISRPKRGFDAPVIPWMNNGSLQPLIERTIDGRLVKDGILERKPLVNFLQNKREQKKHGTWVWTLVVLELWYDHVRNFAASHFIV